MNPLFQVVFNVPSVKYWTYIFPLKPPFLYSHLRTRLLFVTPSKVGSLKGRQNSSIRHRQCGRRHQSCHHRRRIHRAAMPSPLSSATSVRIGFVAQLPWKNDWTFSSYAIATNLDRRIRRSWNNVRRWLFALFRFDNVRSAAGVIGAVSTAFLFCAQASKLTG